MAVTGSDFYATPGPMTDLSSVAGWIDGVEPTPESIAAAVQGQILHPFWAVAYDVEPPGMDVPDLHVRSAAVMAGRMRDRDPRPMIVAREPGARYVGNCRHFSTLAVALFRHAGLPARARCGFASYFEPGKWVDHWIVEYRDGDRWARLDAQVDSLQREIVGLEADPLDLAPGLFLSGGEAWLGCQAGTHDGDGFGILEEWGQWFIPGNVARDLASLNKVEMLPWDSWGILAGLDEPDPHHVDEVAAVTVGRDDDAIRAAYAEEGATVPTEVFSFVLGTMTPVPELGPEPLDIEQVFD